MKKSLVILFVTVLMVLSIAGSVIAGFQNFTLMNMTGVEIHELYISPTGTEDWEEDVLGEKLLPDGKQISINFEGTDAQYWDLLVRDDEGNGIEWYELDLSQISVLTLYFDGEKAWAEVQ